ncbi:MAG: DUF4861 family protein, partial [Pedobacter sp.]|nr:DUF4861 family protein [Chitinophagaceae bacterium]
MNKSNKILVLKPVFESKKSITLLLGFSIICSSLFATQIILTNPSSFARNKEVITIKRIAFGNAKANLFPSVKKHNKTLVTQIIDTNNDGIWDELLIEISLAANSKDTLDITWSAKQETAFPTFANVQLSLRSDTNIPSSEIYQTQRRRGFAQNIAKPYYQMEGPGIENDKVAFRTFFDFRNGKDIYGKIVDMPVLEKVGVGSSWHEMQPWGKDILKVG